MDINLRQVIEKKSKSNLGVGVTQSITITNLVTLICFPSLTLMLFKAASPNPQITVLLLFKDKNFLILGNMANLPKVPTRNLYHKTFYGSNLRFP